MLVMIVNRLSLLVSSFYDYQQGRQAFNNRLNRFPKEVREMLGKETLFQSIGGHFNDLEKILNKAIAEELKNNDMYTKVLGRIVGLGTMMSGDMISWTCDERDFTMGNTHPILLHLKENPLAKVTKIDKTQSRVEMPAVLEIAKYPSDFYKYCGLIPNSRKVAGKQISYNPKLKTLFWKCMRQILMARRSNYAVMYAKEKVKFLKKYQEEYDQKMKFFEEKAKDKKELKKLIAEEKKKEKEERHLILAGSVKMKAHLTALKRTARHLALTIYLAYKYFNKQPAFLPYPIRILGHDFEPPFVDGEDGKPEYLDFLVRYAKKWSVNEKAD